MRKENCIFCKIIDGDVPSTKVYEDEYVLAFKDINPAAKVHILVIPKNHVDSASEIEKLSDTEIARLHRVIAKVARENGIDGSFRLISNCGKAYGQTVDHLHYHVLGGGKINFPVE